MRTGLAERERTTAPQERGRRNLEVVRRAPARRGLGLRHRPGLLLVLFAVCLALLAVGRVTLSFAVVQKTLQTEALVRQQRALEAESVRLQEEIARLAATPRLRRLATERLGLVPAQGVIYLDAGAAGRADISSSSGRRSPLKDDGPPAVASAGLAAPASSGEP